MPSTASVLYFRQEINKEVQNTRRGFNKKPVTGGLLQPIMPLTAVYSVGISMISRNKLVTNLKHQLFQKLCSLLNKNYQNQHFFRCPECWKLLF